MDLQNLISMLYPQAVENYNRYGILPSLTLSQAILESNSGDSILAKSYYNLFGIKGTGTAGSVQLPTWEEVNGKKENIFADFKVYHNYNESLTDHAKLLTTDRYKDVKNAPNYKSGAIALYNAGYATDSGYAGKLISIIEQNQLYKIDEQVKDGNNTPTQTGSNVTTLPYNGGSVEPTGTAFGGILNPTNWINFAKETLYKAAFFIPALIFLAFGIYLLFADQINTGVKAYATGGASLVGDLTKKGES